ncbi:MAG: hydrolase [Pedosphaera sp.]|nr:hydrolase [Pedosphaera sp.]
MKPIHIFWQKAVLIAASGIFIPLSLIASEISPASFQSGDRWCVLGDSITHGGSYHKYVDLFYLTRFPALSLEVINCGISGDTATGAQKRLNWDCLDAKPTVVSVMFGMNDVGGDLYDSGTNSPAAEKKRSERATTYDRAMRSLTKSILDSGAKLILILPSIFDDTADLPGPNNPGRGLALAGYARRMQAIATEYKVATVDFNGSMAAINAAQQKRDPHFTIVGSDRVHPGLPGHLVMAYEFLKAQKLSGIISRITIDAATMLARQLENCEVSGLRAETNGVSFTCLEHALPFPVEAAAKPALDFIPFTQKLNQEMFSVRGLAPGDYELSIDGQSIRTFTAAELADGVNLADETKTPQMQQAFAVLAGLCKKWEAADKLRTIAYCEYAAWPDAKHPVDFVQMPAKLDARLTKIRGTSHEGYIAGQQKLYLMVKPHEAELHRAVDEAVRAARAVAQPKPHQFTLRGVALPEGTKLPSAGGMLLGK